MNRLLITLLLILNSPLSISCDEDAAKLFLAKIKWQTEDYPPYNYQNKLGDLVGVFPDILALTYTRLGINIKLNEIPVIPWARLIKNVAYYPDYAAFSMVTTAERRKSYKLVPLPFMTKISVMALNSRFKNLNKMTKEELNKLVIAVVRGDIGQLLLKKNAISAQQVETTSALSMLKMLQHQRVNAIAYSEVVAHFQFQTLDFNEGKVVSIFSLNKGSLINFAFHKETPTCVTSLFEKTIATLDKEGKLTPIWQKHQNNDYLIE
jgi:polar amino acid transport system substrate-binding protein